MSIHVTNWVLNHSTTRRGARLVLLVISESAEHDGSNAWPSLETIGKRANLSERGVRYALRQLESGGHIVTELHAGGPPNRRVDRRTNRYRVVMDERGASSAPRDVNGGQVTTSRGASNGTNGGQVCAPEPSLTRPETKQQQRMSVSDKTEPRRAIAGLLAIGMKQDQARDLVETYGEAAVGEQLLNLGRHPGVTRKSGWIIAALRDGYELATSQTVERLPIPPTPEQAEAKARAMFPDKFAAES